eukprot:COSAG01_NODE_30247_length_619_cov_25.186538_1_plen_88_part_10
MSCFFVIYISSRLHDISLNKFSWHLASKKTLGLIHNLITRAVDTAHRRRHHRHRWATAERPTRKIAEQSHAPRRYSYMQSFVVCYEGA